jgi:hypothetical protein
MHDTRGYQPAALTYYYRATSEQQVRAALPNEIIIQPNTKKMQPQQPLLFYQPCKFTIQQQQQHSLLSQASWGRLEMKPKRDEKQGDT